MTPDISEFSYGFALTCELIARAGTPLSTAPIFPSLVEEGRAGGGYDVNLSIPGFPLYLQFKRSDCMVRRNAREFRKVPRIDIPFYRLKVTEQLRSDQHKLLLQLDQGPNEVFYAAPLFHRADELDEAYRSTAVADRSFYIRPRDIGPLDQKPHHVAFDTKRFYICSEPREVSGVVGHDLFRKLDHRLADEKRPIGEGPLDDALAVAREALGSAGVPVSHDLMVARSSDPKSKLKALAELAFRFFGAQLFIVQAPRGEPELAAKK